LFVVAGAAAGSINFETTPLGDYGQARNADQLKTEERNLLEVGHDGKFVAKSVVVIMSA
jgi:hypothetical protein